MHYSVQNFSDKISYSPMGKLILSYILESMLSIASKFLFMLGDDVELENADILWI